MDPASDQPARQRRGLLIVLSSPSGAGKTTISRMLLEAEPEIAMSVSATTRPKRPGEVEGRGDGTTDQGPCAQGAGALPSVGWYRRLRSLLGREIDAEPIPERHHAVFDHRELERRTGMEVPQLDGIDADLMARLGLV